MQDTELKLEADDGRAQPSRDRPLPVQPGLRMLALVRLGLQAAHWEALLHTQGT